MKKILLYCLIITGMLVIGFVLIENNSIKTITNLSPLNIEALEQEQEAGAELWCDKKDNDECIIVSGDQIGISRGFLRLTEK